MARGPGFRQRPALTPLQEAQAQVKAAEQALADANLAFERASHSYKAAERNRARAVTARDDDRRLFGFVTESVIRALDLSTWHEKKARTRLFEMEAARSAAKRALNEAQQRLSDLRMESAGNTARETSALRFGGRNLM